MRMQSLIKKTCAVFICFIFALTTVYAETNHIGSSSTTIDRIQLVNEQINLLKDRFIQAQQELTDLQKQHDRQLSQLTPEKSSKNFLDKVALDISVSRSNFDSINIELSDTQETTNWLEKNIQELENQLNVMNIFGVKAASNNISTVQELRADLTYQKKLLALEKIRLHYLQDLQKTAKNILQFQRDNFNRLNATLKSRNMLHIKQQQVKDELAYQEQQNHWLQQLNDLYARIAKVDPNTSREAYIDLKRNIFYANENANLTYAQSLIARYKDQIQQMKLIIFRSNSISLLNEVSNQVQTLAKQMNKLDAVLQARLTIVEKHIAYLTPKKNKQESTRIYLEKLTSLQGQYQITDRALLKLSNELIVFRKEVDHALQNELASRQGLPTFDLKTLLDIGKEMLLVPALTFQVLRSLSTTIAKGFEAKDGWGWGLFIVSQLFMLFAFFFSRRLVAYWLERPSSWREKINTKWLSLQWLHRNLLDLTLIGDVTCILLFLNVPFQHIIFIFYLSLVWLIFKGLLIVSRLCLIETMHNRAGHDVKLYRRFKWIILIGGTIIALTVFLQQLPLIYELKTLCFRLFLFFMMFVSLLFLRSWEVVPNLILSHVESHHPYFRRCVRLIGFLIPILLFANSLIGLIGFMNLVITISWYEGIFLIVLIGYLIVRGLLSDVMEQLSASVIQHVRNGWLWTEAFLKPIDKVLRITLFLAAWTVLFLLYGWDKQSPIVERLSRLLHYQLINALNTTITPISIIELLIVISVFYWTAKWTREFVYRLLTHRTKDMGIRNSLAILSQYSVVVLGVFICLRVLGIDMHALAVVAGMFAFGVGLGLRDLANNFACGFLILLERPLRVGDIVSINGIEGEVMHIGGRAVTVLTWDRMELVVPNAEIFNKAFTNWTARDNVVRTVGHVKISRYDNPHAVSLIIHQVLMQHKDILKDPAPEVFLKEMNDTIMDFEIRYFINIRQVKSRVGVLSSVLMLIWDAFLQHGIKPPYPQHEIFLREGEIPALEMAQLIEQKS